MTKILKIDGTGIELEINYCDAPYRRNDEPQEKGCPCFCNGAGYEYGAYCALTMQDGEKCDDAYSDFVHILSKCPLPDKVV